MSNFQFNRILDSRNKSRAPPYGELFNYLKTIQLTIGGKLCTMKFVKTLLITK